MLQRWMGRIVVLLILGGVVLILALNLDLKGRNVQPAQPPVAPAITPEPDTAKGTQTSAGFREYPIGEEVERNQMRIAAVWLPPVQMDGMAGPPPSDLIHIEADIRATEGNRNGFPKDAFIFGLVVKYTIVSVDADRKSEPPITDKLIPMLARDGEHYGASIEMPRAGHYKLTYAIEPPSATGVGLHRDAATGVDPWWKPFEVSFDWDYAGPPK
jgi:periplasmic iron binding protein